MPKKRNEITQAEFVRQSGLSEGKVRRLIQAGGIEYRKDYQHIYIPKTEVERVKEIVEDLD